MPHLRPVGDRVTDLLPSRSGSLGLTHPQKVFRSMRAETLLAEGVTLGGRPQGEGLFSYLLVALSKAARQSPLHKHYSPTSPGREHKFPLRHSVKLRLGSTELDANTGLGTNQLPLASHARASAIASSKLSARPDA